MSRSSLTRGQVLAEFDRAIGLDVTPRAAVPLAARQVEPRLSTSEPVRQQEAHALVAVVEAVRGTQGGTQGGAGGAFGLDERWLVDPGTPEARAGRLQEIRTAHDQQCPHCTTATAHRQTVFGEGDPAAELMFVGEAPGETEDSVGRPFVGRAGQKLDEMIAAMGFRRQDVYIANVLKSRPPDNRTPLPHEVEACGPYLVAQILAIRPKVIVTLGGPATKLVLLEEQGITRLRGLWRTWDAPAGAAMAPVAVMPTFHPAYLLRNYTHKVRGEVWSDLKQVLARLGG